MKQPHDPLNIDDVFDCSNENIPPETRLWRGVILQQILDAASN